jgi:CubicO group peptidase (beta-lactamase class C family)
MLAKRFALACRALKRNMRHGHEPIVAWLRERNTVINKRENRSTPKARARRSLVRALAVAASLFVTAFGTSAETAPTVRDLAGLWECSRSFGPQLRGPIVIDRTADGWSADLKGRIFPGKPAHGRIEFDFGDGQMFRMQPKGEDGIIKGWWTQARSPLHGYSFITPVDLRAEGKDRLSGEIRPLEDRITFYMPITINEDGKATTYLRSPERNAGRMLKVERVEFTNGEVRLLGFPFGSKEEEIVGRGTVDFENDLMSIYVQRVAQGYEFQRVRPGQSSGFYPRGQPSVPYRYSAPHERADGWPVGTAEDVGISRDAIERFVQMLNDTPITGLSSSDVHAVLIARHGKLVLEEYFHGFDRNTLHDTRSASKSLTSTILGGAIHAGHPISTGTSVYRAMNDGRFPDGLEPRKQAMTVEHLLTMSSGFHCDDNDPNAPGSEDTMQEQRKQPDWYRFALDLPMALDPGEKAIYCSTNPNLLGGVMSRATGRPLEDLFRDLVAEPLGIKRYALNTQPTGEPYMGGGVYFEPRDFMKLAQIMMDGGTWRGRRIVSREWAARATSSLYRIGERGYGYFWWSQEYPYKDRKVRAFYAAGNGGQIAMAFPELKLVICFWGGNYNDPALFIPQRKYIPEYILSAVNR